MTAGTYQLLVCVTAAGLILLAVALALGAIRRTGELVTPWTVFLGMATLDIFLPAAVQTIAPAAVLTPGIIGHIGSALAVFVVAMLLFAIGYAAAGRVRVPDVPWLAARKVNTQRAELVLLLAFAVCLFRIAHSLQGYDSVEAFVSGTLRSRFIVRPPPEGLLPRLLFQLAGVAPVCAFMCVGVLFVNRHVAPLRFGIVWPVAGLLLAITTFFRGSIVMYLVALLVVETFRRKDALPFAPRTPVEFIWGRRRLLTYAAAVVLAFVAYGSVRNWLTNRAWAVGDSYGEALVQEFQQFSAGHGLRGLAAIMDQYPRRIPYFDGKTIGDMLLLPVPRTVWSGKPDWYGIDDITRAMGWPATSQSAVTMPGELWANFGPLGVTLMTAYGLFFGIVFRLRTGPRFRFLYAFNLLPIAFTSFWMAFSAVMNALIVLPVLAIVIVMIIPPGRQPTPGHM